MQTRIYEHTCSPILSFSLFNFFSHTHTLSLVLSPALSQAHTPSIHLHTYAPHLFIRTTHMYNRFHLKCSNSGFAHICAYIPHMILRIYTYITGVLIHLYVYTSYTDSYIHIPKGSLRTQQCIHVFAHIYTYLQVFAHMYTFLHVFAHIYTYLHVFAHMHHTN